MYQPRTYRHWVKAKDLVSFNVVVKETDLYILARTDLIRKAHRLVLKHRAPLEKYIEKNPAFLTTLEPIPVETNAPLIVREMAEAAKKVGTVGPMAAVAGAIAEFVGKELLAFSPEVIIENGGDIFLRSLQKRIVGIYAGESPLTGKIGVEIEAKDTPIGISTSSGTVGHSLSFGKADAAVVLAKSAILSDAAATAIGNLIKQASDIPQGLEFAQGIPELKGVLIIVGGKMGVWGDIKICQTAESDVA